MVFNWIVDDTFFNAIAFFSTALCEKTFFQGFLIIRYKSPDFKN